MLWYAMADWRNKAMIDSQRLQKALAKIEKRKQRQRVYGITEPSKFGYAMRSFAAPVIRGVIGLLYPKTGFVLLGDTDKKVILKLTVGIPVIYAPAHRSVWDVARFIAYCIPHSCLVSGGEKDFYCTVNEYITEINGVLSFDRDDSNDCTIIIEKVKNILKNNHSIIICPESTYNIYGRGMLKLYPGVIKMALDSGAIIVPIGNEIHILRDKQSGKISGDINYMMYEDYTQQSLFRPGDDGDLVLLHGYMKNTDYMNALMNREIERLIENEQFHLGSMTFDLNKKMSELLEAHPLVNNFYDKLSAETDDSAIMQKVKDYLMKCAIVYEYRTRISSCLNALEQRMKALSDKIIAEIDKRHPISQEERERNEREYVDYFLDVHEKVAKKGRSTAYDEIDRYINNVTDESIVNSASSKMIDGIKQIAGY